ncbi:MAG TPA: hypothetical protein VKU38_12365 [Ktedonobacteraceae bacterium]|nr:hypothetical protein [Ktedonobacteraceae bacterium]
MFDFPKADPVERGCGDREPGGVYCESGLSPYGRPLEEFLIDPPLPVPDGLDLVNKPQLWQRRLPDGQPVLDAAGNPIYDLLIWVGEQHYPYCPDYIEETRRYGASRRLNPNLDLSRLSCTSRMILAHARARNTVWQTQCPPECCHKDVSGHADNVEADSESVAETTPSPMPQAGPCLFKAWDLIPQDAAQTVLPEPGPESGDTSANAFTRPLCLRATGSTIYQYRPTGESEDGLAPGLFAILPITGFALIRFADGSVNERAKEKVLAGLESHGEYAIPFYENDR